MGSGAPRSSQFRVAGKRGLSGLRIVVRNGDGRRLSIRCTIHLVPGLWRASGGLVGGPALAPENELASSISAEASSYAMANRPAMGLGIAPHGRLYIDYEPRLPLLARNGHADHVARRPLSGAKRKTYARIELFRF